MQILPSKKKKLVEEGTNINFMKVASMKDDESMSILRKQREITNLKENNVLILAFKVRVQSCVEI